MEPAVAAFKVDGLCAATYTPFNADGTLNTAAIPAYAEELRRNGVKYVFACGTTGESYTLTVAERKAQLEAWIATAGDDITVIAHVGCESLADTKELAAHAQEAGAKAIGVMPSVFFKPSSIEVLIKWLSEVAEAAPALPLYYYHIAIMTGVSFRMDTFLEKIDGRVKTFRGLKFTDFDLHMYANCVAFGDGKYDILYGRDEQALGALAMGARGFVGSTYNYMGATYCQMRDAFDRGDMAAALAAQRQSQAGVDLLIHSGRYGDSVHVGKAMLAIKGVPIGPPRMPKLPMSDAGVATLRSDMEKIGFFDWAV